MLQPKPVGNAPRFGADPSEVGAGADAPDAGGFPEMTPGIELAAGNEDGSGSGLFLKNKLSDAFRC
jgi:hypothetical protein